MLRFLIAFALVGSVAVIGVVSLVAYNMPSPEVAIKKKQALSNVTSAPPLMSTPTKNEQLPEPHPLIELPKPSEPKHLDVETAESMVEKARELLGARVKGVKGYSLATAAISNRKAAEALLIKAIPLLRCPVRRCMRL